MSTRFFSAHIDCIGQCCSVLSLLTRLRVCDATLFTPYNYGERQLWRRPAILDRRSHSKNLAVARLDLLALRLHLGRIGLEQFQFCQRNMLALLLHLRMKRSVGENVDQHLLRLRAEEE